MIDLKALLDQYGRLEDRYQVCRRELGDGAADDRVESCVRAIGDALEVIRQLDRLSIEEITDELAYTIVRSMSDSNCDYYDVSLADLMRWVPPLKTAVKLTNEAPHSLMAVIYDWTEKLLNRLDAKMAARGYIPIQPVIYKDGTYKWKSIAVVMKENDQDHILRIYL
jgi:hypothetical protein